VGYDILTDTDKWEKAKCNNAWVDPDLYHNKNTVAEAVEFCQDCPIRLMCAEYAITEREPYGVWGGLSEEDRKALWKKKSQSRKGIANKKH
jgi:hypothetical protein